MGGNSKKGKKNEKKRQRSDTAFASLNPSQRTSRVDTKDGEVLNWLVSFKKTSSTRESDNQQISQLKDDVTGSSINATFPEQNFPSHQTSIGTQVVDDKKLRRDLQKNCDALKEKLPKKALRRHGSLLSAGAHMAAGAFVDAKKDNVEMVDYASSSRSSFDVCVYLCDDVHQSKDLQDLCLKIPNCGERFRHDESLWKEVACIGFVSIWWINNVVKRFEFNSMLLFQFHPDDDGTAKVDINFQYTEPTLQNAGLDERLHLLANLCYGDQGYGVLRHDTLSASLERYVGIRRTSDTVNLPQPNAPKLSLGPLYTGCLHWQLCLDTTLENKTQRSQLETLGRAIEKGSSTDFNADQIRAIAAFPLAILTHSLKKGQKAKENDVIFGQLSELYQMTSLCLDRITGPSSLQCSLLCRCCGNMIGDSSPLPSLLREMPKWLVIHHGLSTTNTELHSLFAFDGKPLEYESNVVSLCKYGNGETTASSKDDFLKRAHFVDALRYDLGSSALWMNKLLGQSLQFTTLLHYQLPKSLEILSSKADLGSSNMSECYTLANIDKHKLWGSLPGIAKLALAIFHALQGSTKMVLSKLPASEQIKSLSSKFGILYDKKMTYQQVGSASVDEQSLAKQLTSIHRANNFLVSNIDFTSFENNLTPHSSWLKSDDPSNFDIPGTSETSYRVCWKSNRNRDTGGGDELQELEKLLLFLYASKIYRAVNPTSKNKKQAWPQILSKTVKAVGGAITGNVFIIRCNFTQKLGGDDYFLNRYKTLKGDKKLDEIQDFLPTRDFLTLFSKTELEDLGQKWTFIPDHVTKKIRSPILKSLNTQIQCLSLVQKYPYPVFRVTLNEKNRRGHKKVVYSPGNCLDPSTIVLDPLLCARIQTLSYVNSNVTVDVGEGKRSGDSDVSSLFTTTKKQSSLTNVWVDTDNHQRHCVGGAVVNCLHAMGHQQISEDMKQYCLTSQSTSGNKFVWALRRLNHHDIFYDKAIIYHGQDNKNCNNSNLAGIIDDLKNFEYPCVMSIRDAKNMGQSHVVAIWKSSVYDMENQTPYELNCENLMMACGTGVKSVIIDNVYFLRSNSVIGFPDQKKLQATVENMSMLNRMNKHKRTYQHKLKRKGKQKRMSK